MRHKIFLVLMMFTNLTFGQNITISGYIEDKNSSEKLINAILRINNDFVTTNNYGYFTISVKANDTISLIASYLGYESNVIKLKSYVDTLIIINLKETNEIDKIIIQSNKSYENEIKTGSHIISLDDVKLLPSIGGEKDIMKILQFLPGVQCGNEGSNGLFVRGGNIDENLILLDDVPLYNVNHLGGFVSAFNSDAINSVELIKSGFPAKYGGRLSSILDINMKNGNLNKITANLTISPITSNFSINGPIIKQKCSFIISARSLYLGWITRPLTFLQFDGMSIGYNFHDINVKLFYEMNNRNKLYFSFFEESDKYLFKVNNFFHYSPDIGQNSTAWGNILFSFRYLHVFNSKLFAHFNTAYTNYKYQNSSDISSTSDSSRFLSDFYTQIGNFIIKSDFEWNLSNILNFKFGSFHSLIDFTPSKTHYLYHAGSYNVDTSYFFQSVNALENDIYFQSEYKPSNKFYFNFGFRLSDYLVEIKNFFYFEPRIIALYKITQNSSIKASFSKNQQNIHVISSSCASLPMDIWTTSDKNTPPSHSSISTFGFYSSISKLNVQFSIEAYYKLSDNLISFKQGVTYLSVIGNWTDKLETNGKGKSYGIEFFVEKKIGHTKGWLSYALSRTSRQFDNINYGKEFPFKYDRTHDISIVIMHNFNNKFNFSADWVFGSGYPYTLPISRYDIANSISNEIYLPSNQVIVYSDENDYRMRSYHRLDIAFNFVKEKKSGTRTWAINIYNVYNRQNPYFYFSKYIDGKWQIYQQSLFPIIPSLSYSFKFK